MLRDETKNRFEADWHYWEKSTGHYTIFLLNVWTKGSTFGCFLVCRTKGSRMISFFSCLSNNSLAEMHNNKGLTTAVSWELLVPSQHVLTSNQKSRIVEFMELQNDGTAENYPKSKKTGHFKSEKTERCSSFLLSLKKYIVSFWLSTSFRITIDYYSIRRIP